MNKKRKKDGHWQPNQIVLHPDFVKYYQTQKIVKEEDWEKFSESVKTRLPLSFRVNSCQPELRSRIMSYFEDDIFNLKSVEGTKIDDFTFVKPYTLKWYPNSLAWQTNVPKKELRKINGLKEFRRVLVLENDNAGLTRQETVSMIPPLLLNVKPHHKVLDVCAAPGSKTCQILEALHRDEKGEFIPIPKGFVIANDADTKRGRMLVHQLQRFNSANFLVMNLFGQCIPRFHEGQFPKPGEDFKKSSESIVFDRILCDVPCSGDGTVRKSPDIWKKWKVLTGNCLHQVQLKVTRRAVQLLKPGGYLVYSTCTFNPIENEATIAQILRENKDTLKLVDCKDKLVNLIREPGISTWKVQDPLSKVYYTDVTDVPKDRLKLHQRSMFPPTKEEQEYMKLRRCWRILPHTQNTGGFLYVY
eukprot:UN29788